MSKTNDSATPEVAATPRTPHGCVRDIRAGVSGLRAALKATAPDTLKLVRPALESIEREAEMLNKIPDPYTVKNQRAWEHLRHATLHLESVLELAESGKVAPEDAARVEEWGNRAAALARSIMIPLGLDDEIVGDMAHGIQTGDPEQRYRKPATAPASPLPLREAMEILAAIHACPVEDIAIGDGDLHVAGSTPNIAEQIEHHREALAAWETVGAASDAMFGGDAQ